MTGEAEMRNDIENDTLSGKRRALLLLLVLGAALMVAGGVAFLWFHKKEIRLVVSPTDVTLSADGMVHHVSELRLSKGGPIDVSQVTTEGLGATLTQKGDDAISIDVLAPISPGSPSLTLRYQSAAVSVPIRFLPDDNDSVGDGTPDILRLHAAADRDAFRSWFTMLADTAASLSAKSLPGEIGDNTALLRWCYQNALYLHDAPWLSTMPLDAMPQLASVKQYAFPLTVLGSTYFRVRPGPYTQGDPVNGSFSQFADGQTLWQFNTFLVSRDIHAARPGDLIYFRQLQEGRSYPAMILTGSTPSSVVYATSPDRIGIGAQVLAEMHRDTVDNLLRNPNPLWRPVPENSNFLGVYRWNILREDPR